MAEDFLGGCLCGAIRFAASGTPENPHACSCRNCQQHSGAPSVVWVEFPADQVRWLGPGGEPARYRSSDYSSRAFCPTCGSSIGAIDDAPVIALLVGAFDSPDQPEFAPVSHSFDDGQPQWWHCGGD